MVCFTMPRPAVVEPAGQGLIVPHPVGRAAAVEPPANRTSLKAWF
jgi:hypothetical protein